MTQIFVKRNTCSAIFPWRYVVLSIFIMVLFFLYYFFFFFFGSCLSSVSCHCYNSHLWVSIRDCFSQMFILTLFTRDSQSFKWKTEHPKLFYHLNAIERCKMYYSTLIGIFYNMFMNKICLGSCIYIEMVTRFTVFNSSIQIWDTQFEAIHWKSLCIT